jgi:hypothetical protein
MNQNHAGPLYWQEDNQERCTALDVRENSQVLSTILKEQYFLVEQRYDK